MSFTEAALRSKEAKEAIGEGLIVALETWNLQKGVDAMFATGERNGALKKVRAGFELDMTRGVIDMLRGLGSKL
jgi:hypothetical protein